MKIAVVGAVSLTGREVLNIMEEHNFPFEDVVALDTREFSNKELGYGDDRILKVKVTDDYNFADTDIAILVTSGNISHTLAPKIAAAGAFVIDSSEVFSLSPDIPLVIAGINDEAIAKYHKKKIISSPIPSVIMLASVLAPLKGNGLKKASVTVLNATSGFGKEAMDELFNQTKGVFMNESVEDTKKVFPKQIAFNVIPFTGEINKDGSLKEEELLQSETEKVLGAGTLINANAAVIPTFIGSCAYITAEFNSPLSVKDAEKLLDKSENLTVFNSTNEEGYATPAEISGEDTIFVSRLKADLTVPHGLNMFAVMDTLRSGTALNLVKIAEVLVDKYL